LNLYVLNQGNNTVSDLSPQDLSTLATIPVGNTPAWAAVRPDSRRVYFVTQGDGQLYTVRTDTNALIPGSPQPVGGAGANFVLYDKSLNRLYVTNPNAGAVYVFDATTDPPTPMGTLTVPAPPIAAPVSTVCASAACTYSSVMPVSVTALPDGSRFYVASYVTGTATSGSGSTTCPDSNVTAPAGCVIPQVTVFDAGTLTIRTTVFPLLLPVSKTVTTSTGTTTVPVYPFALAPLRFCAPVFPYTPASARFRMSAVAAPDSSRVYASMCDAGSVAIVKTATNTISAGVNAADTLVTDLTAPFSAAAVSSGEPPPQSPVFLLTGQ
jgi:YVTN family beta-propeller protein